MRINELLENHHPLPKGVNKWGKGQYAAFVVVMNPRDFIYLTTKTVEEEHAILDRVDVSLADFKAGKDERFSKDSYILPPFLEIYWPSGKVRSHEGRHRAARVAKAGGDKFTCYVIFRFDKEYEITYTKRYEDDPYGDRDEKFTERFKSEDEASKRRHELVFIDNEDFWFKDVKMEPISQPIMKGGPGSDWDQKFKWENGDMPERFLGQYNKYRTVPTSTMKFAPVKYRGFKPRQTGSED